jgi:hypothetical protein
MGEENIRKCDKENRDGKKYHVYTNLRLIPTLGLSKPQNASTQFKLSCVEAF